MSFIGPAGVTVAVRRNAPGGARDRPGTAPLPTLTKTGYDAATGVHTYDINVPAGVLTLALEFRNTGGTVRDVKILQPGYSLASYPTFSNEYLGLLRDLSPNVLRLMDFTQTNNNPVANWADRTTPTHATQTKVGTAGDLVPQKGIAWEYAIQLANELDADVWVNVPARATNDYVRNLAHLLKTQLEPGLNVYLEYSNEVWNTQFDQAAYNTHAGAGRGREQPQLEPRLTTARRNATTLSDRRYARGSKEITDEFRTVWTTAFNGSTAQPDPTNTKVRAVLGQPVRATRAASTPS